MNVDTEMANTSVTWSSTPSSVDIVDGVISASNIICENGASNVVMSNDSYGVGTTTVTCRVNDTALTRLPAKLSKNGMHVPPRSGGTVYNSRFFVINGYLLIAGAIYFFIFRKFSSQTELKLWCEPR